MILPKKEVIEKALIKDYQSLYDHSIDHLEEFWQQIASELFWFRPWEKVADWQYPYAHWFIGGETNLVYNALDRWQKTEIANKLALIWVGQPEDKNSADFPMRTFTYKQLNVEVCRLANGLKSLGVKKGDRVIIYLPRIPEQFISMLACAKIGALHSVVYSGFSTDALKNRIEDAQAKIVITTNFYPYKDKILTPLENVREAIKDFSFVEKVIVIKRQSKNSYYDLDNLLVNEIFYDDLVAKQDTICSTAILNSTDPSFILYTSGSTGKPKGVVHSHGGYMVGVYATMKYVFDIKGDEIFWSTADAGWITGHSYILYGPLLNGITTFVYEGTPDYPDIEVWWRLIDRFKITHFYTAPTAIRALMRYGEEPIKKYSFSSLRILGSVGEPINPEAWLWFYKNIGREKIPIMDTWWQTETGMHILTPLPSTPLKPGSCNKPFFGVIADVVDENGNSVGPNKQGYLVLKTPWPSMLLGLWNNPQKYKQTYFEKFTNSKSQTTNESTISHNKFKNFIYFTGDSAKIDEDGYFWIIGRNDDVIKVSGHRLGSAEIEHAIVEHQAVAEAAVIGKPHQVKGESIKAFVILKIGQKPTESLKTKINNLVREKIGPIASLDEIEFVDKLPKTRSGKILRRVLKSQELKLPVEDLSTIED